MNISQLLLSFRNEKSGTFPLTISIHVFNQGKWFCGLIKMINKGKFLDLLTNSPNYYGKIYKGKSGEFEEGPYTPLQN